jgi:hypothetical protein
MICTLSSPFWRRDYRLRVADGTSFSGSQNTVRAQSPRILRFGARISK